MKKILALAFLLSLAALPARAQYTNVSGTVIDPNGIPYAGSTIKAQLSTPGGTTSGQPTVSGTCHTADKSYPCQLPVDQTPPAVLLDGNGSFTMQFADNLLTTPSGTQWLFTVTTTDTQGVDHGVPPPLGFGTRSFSVLITITGTAVDISTPLSGAALALTRLTGSAVTFPTLNQVLNPNGDKAFDLGGNFVSFFNGYFNLSGATAFSIPNSAGATASSTAQIAFDTTLLNIHCWNGADAICLAIPTSATVNDGDVLGLSVSAGQVQAQDLGPVNAPSGGSFLYQFNSSLLGGDVHCFDDTAIDPLQAWPNCTPGAADTSVAGATSTYPITIADQLSTIDHDSAASASVTVTLPTADSLGLNPGFVFVYSNHSSHADTVTPTAWTINGNPTLPVNPSEFCRIRVDPASATNWLADCVNSSASGNLSGTLSSPHIPVATGANSLADSSCTDDGTNPTRCPNGSNTAVNGNYEEYTVDTGGVTAGLALCVTSNVDGSGRPKVLPCSHTAAQPGAGFVGIAKTTVAAAGIVPVCWTVNCSATFDNASVALNEAILSVTTDGRLHDTGSQSATAGQPNFAALAANGGTGTNALISLTGMLAQNPNGGGGNGNQTSVSINGAAAKKVVNFNGTTPAADANNQLLTYKSSNSGNTTSASVEVPLATTGQAGLVQLTGALGGSSASPTLAAPYNVRVCTGNGLGDGLNAIPAGTYVQLSCVNRTGSTMTITGINCFTDNNGTSTLNAANNAATGLLTGAVTCTNTKSGGGASGTQSGTTTLANNDAVNFTFVSDGTTKTTTWTVTVTQ